MQNLAGERHVSLTLSITVIIRINFFKGTFVLNDVLLLLLLLFLLLLRGLTVLLKLKLLERLSRILLLAA